MMSSYDDQLARADELAPLPSVVAHLFERVPADEAVELYDRFMWEVRRDRSPTDALQTARFADTLRSREQLTVAESLAALTAQIRRTPRLLDAGEHAVIGDHGQLTVLNMTDQAVSVSERELIMAADHAAGPRKLTVVIDDQPPSAKVTAEQVIWHLPRHVEQAEDAWRPLMSACGHDGDLPHWVLALCSHRVQVTDAAMLPTELQARAHHIRRMLVRLLTDHVFGPEPGRTIKLEEDEVLWALGQIEARISELFEQPRLVLGCRSVQDLTPPEDWLGHGPASTRAMLTAITGDDPYVTAALRSADRLRIGQLHFTGDPEHHGDDLLSASLGDANCWAVLRPATLAQTMFFAGPLHPAVTLPVPRQYGTYSSVAVGEDVRDLALVRALLGLCLATPRSAREYFQGVSSQMELRGDQPSRAFQALIAACAARREHGDDHDDVTRPLTHAALSAAFNGLDADDPLAGMGGVHLGALSLADVEQVVLGVEDPVAFFAFKRQGVVPDYLRPVFDHFAAHDIRVRLRSPRTPAGGGVIA